MGREVVLGIRPHDLSIAGKSDSPDLSGRVSLVEQLGTETLIDVDVADTTVQVSEPPTTSLADGQTIGLKIDHSRLHIFDAATEEALCHGIDHL